MPDVVGDGPSFDGLLDSDQPKDTEVIIVEEGSSSVEACAVSVADGGEQQGTAGSMTTVAAHWTILWGHSACFRAKLERWSGTTSAGSAPQQQQDHNSNHHQQQHQQQQQQDLGDQVLHPSKKQKCSHPHQPPYQYSLQLLVPPGQLELGRRLITTIYSSSPDLSDLDPLQLMHLAVLAECYGVGKVVTAAAKQLQQLSVDTLSLATAVAVFALPEACLAVKVFKQVRATATDKLQQELGDLEVVWGDKDKQQQLLGLPLDVLLVLLRDPRTRVAREDTVVYTATRWMEEHPGISPQQQQQQQQQLMGVLRLPYCTPTYLATAVAPTDSWLRRAGLTERLCSLPARGNDRCETRVVKLQQGWPAWQLPQRPASCKQGLVLEWALPVSQVEEAMTTNISYTLRPPESLVTWCGRRWGMAVTVEPTRAGLFLLSHQAAAEFDGECYAIDTDDEERWSYRQHGGYVDGKGDVWGDSRMLDWASIRQPTWHRVREWLEDVVHPDGCLHLHITVSKVR